jgi:ribonuclease HII
MSPAGWEIEVQYWEMGRLVAGVDEAGRGPLAGPVVAAAVILPFGCTIPGIDDSKKLSPARREELFSLIEQQALSLAWAVVDTEFIDRRGILPATFFAMTQALEKLVFKPSLALIDGNLLPPQLSVPAQAIIGGDGECGSIAAASIVAKVTRDRLMCEWHQQFPHYGFNHNKGYGTDFHLQALSQHGPCPLHRRSFSPVRDLRLPFEG